MSIDTGTRRAVHPPADDAGSVTGARAAVPWATVLSLGLVLAYADGAWGQILRGATGAIERTQTPFASWLKESTAVAPLFVAAVLGAFALSVHWFGPRNRSPKAQIVTGLLVVVAATLTALAVSSVSAAYDYHLQALHVHAKAHPMAGEARATLALHVRGVWYVTRWLLLTNLVAVGWLVVMQGGGRLRAVALTGARSAKATALGTTRLALVWALAGSAAIHAAVIGHHLTEWPAAGVFFLLLTVWELAVGGLLLARVSDRLFLLAAVALSVGPLALWLTSRTTGMPFGPEAGVAEGLGLPDVIASALEAVSLVTAVAVLRRGSGARTPAATSAHVRALVLVGLFGLTTVAVAAAGLGWFDPFGIAAIQSTVHTSH